MLLYVPLIATHFRFSPERCFTSCQSPHIWPLFGWSYCIKPLINGNYEWISSTLGKRWGRCIWFPGVLGHSSQIDFYWSFGLTEQVIDGLINSAVDGRSRCIQTCCPWSRLVIDRVYAQVRKLIEFVLLFIFLTTVFKHSRSMIESLRIPWRSQLERFRLQSSFRLRFYMGHRCVILNFVAWFILFGILGVGCHLGSHCVLNPVLIAWEDTLIIEGIIRWGHWLGVWSLEEAYWTYFELDHFLISDIRQVIVLHTKSFALCSVWCCLKSTRQKPAIAENGMFGGHGWTGYFSVPAGLLGRYWAHIMSRWMNARAS